MKLFIDTVMKRIYLFNIVAWNYREKIGFPVCKMENFAGLQAHRKRGKSARASLTPHHTLNVKRSARFIAQHLAALLRILIFLRRSKMQLSVTSSYIQKWISPGLQDFFFSTLYAMSNIFFSTGYCLSHEFLCMPISSLNQTAGYFFLKSIITPLKVK